MLPPLWRPRWHTWRGACGWEGFPTDVVCSERGGGWRVPGELSLTSGQEGHGDAIKASPLWSDRVLEKEAGFSAAGGDAPVS